MKMSAVSSITITGLLLLCLGSQISCTDSQKGCDYYGVKDGNFTVPLKHKMDDIDTLRWYHNGTTLVNRRNGIFIAGKEYVSKNGSLLLTHLQESSSGKYTPELFDKDGKNKLVSDQSMTLCVLDRVTMPTIKTECLKERKTVTFTCKAGQQAKNVIFGWLQNDKVLVDEKDQSLTVPEKVEKDAFRCKVSNQVSTMTSTPVKETCFKRDPGFPENLLGEYGWFILAGGGGAVVLVLLIIVIVCCVRTRRRKKVVQIKEEEELRMMVTNPSQHHHHHHNHGHQHNHPPHPHPHPHPQTQPQQQPAGHTGPRQHRSKQQRPKAPNPPNTNPQPSPRRPTQEKGPRGDEEQAPPLPQPRKKAPRTHNRV